MTYPGTKSSFKTIEELCDKLLEMCKNKQVDSIIIPLLGCGVGSLKEEDVLNIYKQKFINCDTKIIIVINKKEL